MINKKIFKLLIIAVLVLVLISVFFNKNVDNKMVVTNYDLETPNLADKNLTQFYLWTIEDPLFTAPGFDIESFSKALQILENEEAIYMKKFNLEYKIFPSKFLEDVINVNKIHNDFINNPTVEGSRALIEAYKITINDYKKSVQNLKLAVNDLIPDSLKDRINKIYLQHMNTITNINTFYNDLDKIDLNADVLVGEIVKRENCLEKGISCIRPVNNFSDFKIIEKSYGFNKKDILPFGVLSYPQEVTSNDRSWYGPYIVSTQCLGWSDDLKPKDYLMYILKIKITADSPDAPKEFILTNEKNATNRYFRLLEENEKKFFGSNLKRITQEESNDYICPSVEYKAKLSSIDFLVRNYKDKQIFTNLLKLIGLPNEAREFFLKGETLERKFYNADFPSEIDADNMANYYGLLYKQILVWMQRPDYKKQEWLMPLFNRRKSILDIHLAYKRGLNNIENQMQNIWYFLYAFRIYTSYLESNNISFRPQFYTYMSRSGWGLFYFPFSKSFYRNKIPLDYILRKKVDNIGPDKQYITYKEAIKYFTKVEIDSWYAGRKNVIDVNYANYLKGFPALRR
jgi:hypothetical protein